MVIVAKIPIFKQIPINKVRYLSLTHPTRSANNVKKMIDIWLLGVAELRYETQTFYFSNSYSLRPLRLCVRKNHTFIHQRRY